MEPPDPLWFSTYVLAAARERLVPTPKVEYGKPLRHVDLSGWLATDGALRRLLESNGDFETLRVAAAETTGSGVTDSTLRLLGEHAALRGVDFPGQIGVTDAGLRALGGQCPQLREVRLVGVPRVSDAGVEALARQCAALEVVDVSGSPLVSDRGVEALGMLARELRWLGVSSCAQVGDEGLGAVLRNCRSLRRLEARALPRFRGRAFVRARPQGAQPLVCATALEHVDVADCPKVGNRAVSWIAASSGDLETLVLSGCAGVADSALIALCNSHCAARLQRLELDGCARVTGAGMAHVAGYLTRLRRLDAAMLPEVGGQAIEQLFRSLRELRWLSLAGCTDADDWSLVSPEMGSAVCYLTHFCMDGVDQVGDFGVLGLVRGNPKLEAFSARHCDQLTSKTARALAGYAPRLCRLDLSFCGRVTEDGLLAAAQGCPNITELLIESRAYDIDWPQRRRGPQLSDAGLTAVCRALPRLRVLNVAHNFEVTLRGLARSGGGGGAGAVVLRELDELRLAGCRRLDFAALKRVLARQLPFVTTLDTQGCAEHNAFESWPQGSGSSRLLAEGRFYVAPRRAGAGFEPLKHAHCMRWQDFYVLRRGDEDAAADKIRDCWKLFALQEMTFLYVVLKAMASPMMQFRKQAIRTCQRWIRTRLVRLRYLHLLKSHRSARRIQCCFRRYRASVRAWGLRVRVYAALLIQTVWRGSRVRLGPEIAMVVQTTQFRRWRLALQARCGMSLDPSDEPVGAPFRRDLVALHADVHVQLEQLRTRVREAVEREPPPTIALAAVARADSSRGVHALGVRLWPRMDGHKSPRAFTQQELAERQLAEAQAVADKAPTRKRRPLCDRCGLRHAAYRCAMCIESHCLTCSSALHSRPDLRHHQVEPAPEPEELVSETVQFDKSLQAAQVAMRAVLAPALDEQYARHRAELQRMKREQEAAARRAELEQSQALETSLRNNRAATLVQALFFGWRARADFAVKLRARNEAEQRRRLAAPAAAATRIQSLVRMHQTLTVFNQLPFDVAARERVLTALAHKQDLRRRLCERSGAFHAFLTSFNALRQHMLADEMLCDGELLAPVLAKEADLARLLADMEQRRARDLRIFGSQSQDDDGSANVAYMLEVARKQVHWLRSFHRQRHRRAMAVQLLRDDVKKQIDWLAAEAGFLEGVQAEVASRLAAAADPDSREAAWLREQAATLRERVARFDQMQGSVLETETARLREVRRLAEETSETVRNVDKTLRLDRHFEAERRAMQLQLGRLEPDSPEAVALLERQLALKERQRDQQNLLEADLLPALTALMRSETRVVEAVVFFLGDDGELGKESIERIQCVLKHPFKARRHFRRKHWVKLYERGGFTLSAGQRQPQQRRLVQLGTGGRHRRRSSVPTADRSAEAAADRRAARAHPEDVRDPAVMARVQDAYLASAETIAMRREEAEQRRVEKILLARARRKQLKRRGLKALAKQRKKVKQRLDKGIDAENVLAGLFAESEIQAANRGILSRVKATGRALLQLRRMEMSKPADLMTNFMEAQRMQLGAEGIGKVALTVGHEAEERFREDNEMDNSRGGGYWATMERSVGLNDRVMMHSWRTRIEGEGATHITISHSKAKSKFYTEYATLQKQGWIAQQRARGCPLQVWLRAVPGAPVITDLAVSFSVVEEGRLEGDFYTKITPSLRAFGLGEMYLWYRTEAQRNLPDAETLQQQLLGFEDLLRDAPDNEALQLLVRNTTRDLARVRLREGDRTAEPPLVRMRKMLQLNPQEMQMLIDDFSDMDADGSGAISIEELIDFLGLPHAEAFHRHLFGFLDSDHNGTLTLEEFVVALGTFNLLGKPEMVKFIFKIFDKDASGKISENELVSLMNAMNPENTNGVVSRALMSMDIDGDAEVEFSEFARVIALFPSILYPAYLLQDRMRKAFLGKKFWEGRMKMFSEMRRRVREAQEQASKAAGLYVAPPPKEPRWIKVAKFLNLWDGPM